jgi:hypothetical protein
MDITTDEEEEDNEGSFQIHEEMLEDISQSSEGDIDSLNTGTSSHIHTVTSPFNLRLPWKHESVVMELLNYYTEQVSMILMLEKDG